MPRIFVQIVSSALPAKAQSTTSTAIVPVQRRNGPPPIIKRANVRRAEPETESESETSSDDSSSEDDTETSEEDTSTSDNASDSDEEGNLQTVLSSKANLCDNVLIVFSLY